MMASTIRAVCALVGALVAATSATAESLAQAKPYSSPQTELAIPNLDFRLDPAPQMATRTNYALALPASPAATPALAFTRSRDGALSATSADGRVKMRLSSAAGSAMFAPGRHVVTGFLDPKVSWRQEADLTLSTPLGANSNMSVSAGTLNLRSPSLYGVGTSRGLGEPNRWMENKVVDVGLKLHLFDDLLRYSGGLSWSDYRMVQATRFIAPDDPMLFAAPRARPGNAYWHRVDAKLPLGEGRGASAYVEIGRQSDDYRSMRSSSLSPLLFDGRTYLAGGKVHSGRLNLALSHSAVASAYGDNVETLATLDFAGMRISHTVRHTVYDLPLSDSERFRSDSRARTTSLRLSPARLLDPSSTVSWLPDTLTIRSNLTESERDGRRSRRDSLGLAFGWKAENSSTDIGVTRVVRRQRSLLADLSPSTETSFDLNHSRTLGPVEVSAYGSVTIDRSATAASKMYGGGLSLSTSGAKLPKLSLSVDYNRFDRRDQFDPLFEDRGLSLAVSADLTPSLRRWRLPKEAYLKLKGYGDWRVQRIGPFAADQQVEPGIMLMFGMPF